MIENPFWFFLPLINLFFHFKLKRFWCTMQFNNQFNPQSSFRDLADKPYLRSLAIYIKWASGELGEECYSVWRNAICILSIHDLPIMASKPHFFANKFLLSYDPLTYQCMEQWYEEKARREPIIDMKGYCDWIQPKSTSADCGLKPMKI